MLRAFQWSMGTKALLSLSAGILLIAPLLNAAIPSKDSTKAWYGGGTKELAAFPNPKTGRPGKYQVPFTHSQNYYFDVNKLEAPDGATIRAANGEALKGEGWVRPPRPSTTRVEYDDAEVRLTTPGAQRLLAQVVPVLKYGNSKLIYMWGGHRKEIDHSGEGVFRYFKDGRTSNELTKARVGEDGRFSGFIDIGQLSALGQRFSNVPRYVNTLYGPRSARWPTNDKRFGPALAGRWHAGTAKLRATYIKGAAAFRTDSKGNKTPHLSFSDYGRAAGNWATNFVPGCINVVKKAEHTGQIGTVLRDGTEVQMTDLRAAVRNVLAKDEGPHPLYFRLCFYQEEGSVMVAMWFPEPCLVQKVWKKGHEPKRLHRHRAVANTVPATIDVDEEDERDLDLGIVNSGEVNGAIFEVAPIHGRQLNPFLTLQPEPGEDSEEGYNTSAAVPLFDEVVGPTLTRDLRMRDLDAVTKNGVDYLEFVLRLNETTEDPAISLEGLEIYTSRTGSQVTDEVSTLGTLRYDLDSADDRVVFMDATRGGVVLYIPVANFAGANSDDYVYLHSAFAESNGGSEEWSVDANPNTPVIPPQRYTVKDLGTLGGSRSDAQAINDSGEIVGGSETPSGDNHAFLYSGGRMRDLGTLGGSSSYASGINNSGQIVGGGAPLQVHLMLFFTPREKCVTSAHLAGRQVTLTALMIQVRSLEQAQRAPPVKETEPFSTLAGE